MSTAKNQGGIWPEGVMSPEEIKAELMDRYGLTLSDLKLRIRCVSYDCVRGTIAGRYSTFEVLQYLTKLGIKHGRTPSPSRKAS
ncbi:hypothetical protein LEP1GSC126_0061 [Leptospira kirschneri str. 200801774]|nr:hypothetical protein [Leptospira kirschneri]EMO78605.1 hypothetical protein LEP1GSC126_0061 [Leptospira kirschneri str. 200801774]